MDLEMVTLSKKENKRAIVLAKVDRGEMTAAQAKEVIGLGIRQIRRLLAKYRQEGPQALAHGNRGRQPQHALSPTTRTQVLELAQTKYAGFNHSHLTDKLHEEEKLEISRSSVRRILVGAGIKSPRKRRPPKHRKRRERMPQQGMMLQLDGSHHPWLEERGPWLTLVGAIDDATGEVPYSLFRLQEDAQGYFLLLQKIAADYGLPLAVYSDRHSIFVHQRKGLSLEEELEGEPEATQFGRLLRDLEIQSIFALSPQAKGRIERLWGTFQDRLVSELRLAGARTMEEANRVLGKFLPAYNRQFRVEAAQAGSAYRPLPPGAKPEAVFCFKYHRVVANDNTVNLDGRLIQIPPGPGGRSYAKARATIHEAMDGSLGVYYQGKRIGFEAADEKGIVLRTKRARHSKRAQETREVARTAAPKQTEAVKLVQRDQHGVLRPTADHPWRRSPMVTKSLNT
jgi:transposase